MYKDLLPIGSIVLLKDAKRKLMINGRIVTKSGEDEIYDYTGVIYPVGVTGSEDMYFFNRDAIDTVFFIGYQDKEELDFRSNVLDTLGELTVVDGQIVPKLS